MKTIAVLIPCYNEEKSIPLLYQELVKVTNDIKDYIWEFMFINDGSKDQTLEVIKRLKSQDDRVTYVSLSRNFGKEAAMLAGMDNFKADALIIIDADLQHPPSLIPEMVKEWEKGYADVYAKKEDRGKESWLRKKLTHQYYDILQKLTNIEIYPNVGDFRLLDKKCVSVLSELRETGRYTKGLFSYIGFKKKELPFKVGKRIEGNSKWNLFKLFNFAWDGLTSFTGAPLRLSTIFGFILSLSAFAYMVFILIRTLLYGDEVRGFPTLIIIILFMGGVQLISLGIIGEYIGRIYNETKNRPIYIVEEKNI